HLLAHAYSIGTGRRNRHLFMRLSLAGLRRRLTSVHRPHVRIDTGNSSRSDSSPGRVTRRFAAAPPGRLLGRADVLGGSSRRLATPDGAPYASRPCSGGCSMMHSAPVPLTALALAVCTAATGAQKAPDARAVKLFHDNCAQCHGDTGDGKGWAQLD